MKKRHLLLIVFPLLLATGALAQSDSEQPYVSKKFTSSSLKELVVETSGGSISVTGGRSDGFKVDMFVKPNNWNGKDELSKDEIEDRLEDYDILIGTEGNKVVATAKRKSGTTWNDKKSISIGFKVYAPRNVATNLKTSGGSIKIASLTGEQNFQTSGGSLKVEDLSGMIHGRTSGGSIDVTNCTNEIDLETSGGSIKATGLKGKIELNTSGGSITLNSINGDVVAHTSGGSVKGDDISGALDTGTSGGSVRLANVSGSIKASTSAGSVEVELTKLGKYVDISSSAGSVRVTMPMDAGMDLNLKGNKVSIPLKNFDGRAEKEYVRGKMNGGGIPVTLSASSGSVYVN
ncbi:DUF4097 family beta strand repeat-containing protein [Dyadobacter sp. Leaf189]|uniref:DUF4097 family beta strand repeat-containing protein n=1 Tax=Dyadobacter sp. Leaf189 TaxID=1736295 RepID=UPI0006F56C1D|nr:DUF4097 family beta strand repeat-containing protein [Dyadobacter sp. Leaf189]KQS33525.1 hypothetical protein ASG33_05495 [Dyadobacter sp. Leaf189]